MPCFASHVQKNQLLFVSRNGQCDHCSVRNQVVYLLCTVCSISFFRQFIGLKILKTDRTDTFQFSELHLISWITIATSSLAHLSVLISFIPCNLYHGLWLHAARQDYGTQHDVSMATPREQSHGNPIHGGLGWAGNNLIWNGMGWSKKKTYLLWIGLGMGWILAFTTHTLCHRWSINESLLFSPTRERVKKSAPRRMLRLVYNLMNMFMKCCQLFTIVDLGFT